MRLHRRPRYDTLRNEARKRGGSWGRWLYLGLVAVFFAWLFDIFFGDLIYFRAEGLVMRDRVALATQYVGSIRQLRVEEGVAVKEGELVAELLSQSVEETLAKLSTDMANVLSRSTQLSVRKDVIDSVAPMIAQRSKEARAARLTSEEKTYAGLYTVERRFKLIENEINSMSSEAEAKAESKAIARDLPRLAAAVDAALGAMGRLKEVYADGRITAPVSGVVGRLNVSKGSVVRPGDSLMEIFHGTPYVLAYVPEGALYRVECGDRVEIKVGFISLTGRVARIYPVTAQLPAEFRDSLRQPRRAQIVRIDFEPDQAYPSLFARAEISAADWPPQWLSRLWHSVVNGIRRPAGGGACIEGAPTAQK